MQMGARNYGFICKGWDNHDKGLEKLSTNLEGIDLKIGYVIPTELTVAVIGYGTPALGSVLVCSCLKEGCSSLEYKDSRCP